MCAPPRARARPSPAAFAGASCGCVAARACVLEDVSSRVSRACVAPSRRAQSVLCLIRLNSCFLVPLFFVAPRRARRSGCSGWVAFHPDWLESDHRVGAEAIQVIAGERAGLSVDPRIGAKGREADPTRD